MTLRRKARVVAAALFVLGLGGVATATEPVLGIRPDPRAVESGLYIQPVELAKRAELPFAVIEPSGVDRRRGPVRGSLPFCRGELKDPKNVRLLDDAGREVPVQGFAAAFWPEGTVKFLCIDFLTDLEAGRTKRFRLEYGTAVKPNVKSALRVNRAGGRVAVDTGLMKVTFAPGQEFCSGIMVGGRATTRGPVRGRLLVSEGEPLNEPREYPLVVEKVELVENGPVQATVYLKGSYGTLRSATPLTWQKRRNVPRYVFHGFVRLYADSGRMDIIHGFGYNGDESRDFVRRYGLVVPLATKNARFVYGGDKGVRREVPLNGDLQLVQPGHSSWQLRGASQANGRRFGGWGALKGDGASAVFGLRDAWQQWPVSFHANGEGELGLDIYGGTEDTFLDLRFVGEGFDKKTGKGFHKSKSTYTGEKFSTHYTGGRGPTHRAMGLLKISELVLDFTPGADPASVGNGHHKMLIPWPGVGRFSDTRVFGLTGYYTEDPKMRRARDYFSIILDYSYVAHNVNGLFGWVDYPDAPDFGRPKDGRFDTSIFGGGVGWTNGERQVMGYFGHYVASGWRRALDLGHQSALHSIGIDIEHPDRKSVV